MTNKATIIATLALSLSAPAVASNGATFVNNEIGWETRLTPSTKTRAEVVAELQAVQHAGDLARSYEFPEALEPVTSTLSRETVQRGATEMTNAERDSVHRVYDPQHARES